MDTEEYVLALNNQKIGLRKTDDGLLIPKNLRVFDSLLENKELEKFQVCLVTRGSPESITSILSEIEERMRGKRWIFFVADYSESDLSFEKIKNHNTKAEGFFPIKFKYSKTCENAQRALKKISDIYLPNYPYRIELQNQESVIEHREIQSFCFVATKEMKEEAAILLKSLRQFHQQPAYVFCDKETKSFLSCLELDLKGVSFRVELEEEDLQKIKKEHLFQRKNEFHRPECILKKMECMNFALQNHDNTFFLDGDVIVIDSLQENFDKKIFLSPHYYKLGTPISDGATNIGFFNAGYIFCADANFPDFWREAYLTDSAFYEQECMNRVCEKFDIGLFSRLHNVGFWRDSFGIDKETKSFHAHVADNANLDRSSSLKQLNADLKKKIMRFLKESQKEEHKTILEFIEKMENGWGGVQENFSFRESNPDGRINLHSQITFNSHRSGWRFAIDALTPLHNRDGILFDGFLENNFAWNLKEYRREGKNIPYKKPWVGFFHNPQNMPPWFFNEFSLQNIIAGTEFQKSLDSCLGLFALSEYHAKYLRETTGKKTSVLIHPTETPKVVFDFDRFLQNNNKAIVNIGYWLRKLNSIFSLPIASGGRYEKIRLIPFSSSRPLEAIDSLTEREKVIYDIKIDRQYANNTTTKSSLSNENYDALLSENIVFLDLYDSSANNAVIECIARATPLLVNPLPAVVEYLGNDYPLYFNSLEEAAEKADNLELLFDAHKYLKNCETKKKLSKEYFLKSLEESEVYQLLP